MDITRWSILKLDWLYSLQPKMEKLYTISENKTVSWMWLRSWFFKSAKFRLIMKKVGKTTRSFRYDLNRISYGDTVEVTNRFKNNSTNSSSECLKNYRWRFITLYSRQWPKTSPKKKKCKKEKWLSEEALQISEKRREAKGKGEKDGYRHLNAEFQRIARRDKIGPLSDQCKGRGKR